MKTIFPVFLLFFFFTFSVQAQLVEEWTEPVALTDSTFNSSNPIVVLLNNSGVFETYMIYEKYGAPYRQIWWKKISEPMSGEEMLVGGWPEFDYRNPQVLYNNFLVCEIDAQEGQADLWGFKIDGTGLVGTEFQLTNTLSDERSFFADPYNSNICCWESEGRIFVAEPYISGDSVLFTNIEIVDSVNCYDPICKNNYVAWRKVENNESHIYYSRNNYPPYQWSDPDTIILTNDNINLSLSTSVPDMGGGYTLCWQSLEKIYFSNTWGSTIYISSPELPEIEKYYEPTAFHLVLLTESIPELYSFAGEIGPERDIYIIDNMFIGGALNISDDEHINKNPRLFSGHINWPYYEIINVWQTEIDGVDVLFESHALYMATGNIDESKSIRSNAYPNPFTETLNIELKSDQSELIVFEFFSMSGEKLFNKEIQGQANTQQSISWNPTNNGLSLSEGIYFVKLTQGKSSVVRKVVYSK